MARSKPLVRLAKNELTGLAEEGVGIIQKGRKALKAVAIATTLVTLLAYLVVIGILVVGAYLLIKVVMNNGTKKDEPPAWERAQSEPHPMQY